MDIMQYGLRYAGLSSPAFGILPISPLIIASETNRGALIAIFAADSPAYLVPVITSVLG
jgi:hypothetical protein